MMKNNVIYSFLVLILIPFIICAKFDQLIIKRNNNNNNNNNPLIDNTDYPDYPKYNEYTVVPKRAALLFDQLMIALQKVVDNQGGNIGSSKSVPKAIPLQMANPQIQSSEEQTMDLQRRGQSKSRVYWRCYFNAVTCFKKK